MNRFAKFITSSFLLLVLAVSSVAAYSNWNEVTDDMDKELDKAGEIYSKAQEGYQDAAKAQVNVAYYQYYEKVGFERTVQAKISGNRAGVVELQFATVKKAITTGKSAKDVASELNKLKSMLREDANKLDPKPYWGNIAEGYGKELSKAYSLYRRGQKQDCKTAFDSLVDKIYNDESVGFYKKVQKHLAPDAVLIDKKVESARAELDKGIAGKSAGKRISEQFDNLSESLTAVAADLDHWEATSSWSAFWINFMASIAIILKEGFEAILIVAAIIAYLRKKGMEHHLKSVYLGCVIGVFASILMAILLNALAGGQGDKQELIEGLTMIFATAVLFYTSNWMVSKADEHQWEGYIKAQVSQSSEKGSVFGLASTAFLAVFREGAEIVLFYQALVLGANGTTAISAIWWGLGIGCVLLVGVYLIIKFISIKMKLKPFFMATSILMFIMCVAFVGSGIDEFIEGDFISATQLQGFPTFSILGIYPTVETLLAQLLFLIPVVLCLVIQIKNQNESKRHIENNDAAISVSPKKIKVAAPLQIILGYFGAGNFYLGNVGKAVMQYSCTVFGAYFVYMGQSAKYDHPVFGAFFTVFGILAIVYSVVSVVVDFIKILRKKMTDGNKMPVTE